MRVDEMVRDLVGGCSSVVHAVRLGTVIKTVEGIVRGGRLVPAMIGRNLPGGALPKHGIKCVDRLLGNSKMTGDRRFIFHAIAHRLLRGCTRPVILVDWTQSGGRHEALVAAVPIGGRALPIYIEVHPLKKLGNAAVEKRFLSTLKTIRTDGVSGPRRVRRWLQRAILPGRARSWGGTSSGAFEARPRPYHPSARRSRKSNSTRAHPRLPSSSAPSASS